MYEHETRMATLASIATAALLVDTLTALYLLHSDLGGSSIRVWYQRYRIGAYIMDVLSLIICVCIMSRLLPAAPLWKRLAIAVAIKLLHDIVFGVFIHNSRSKSPIIRLFKEYADEMGAHVLWADASMVIATVLISQALLTIDARDTALLGTISAYIGLLTIYSY